MKKFYVGAKIEIEVSSKLIGEDSASVMEKMYEVLARAERELGEGLLVQLCDQTVHSVRFDNVESELETVEEIEKATLRQQRDQRVS